ncbi:MAG: NrfD/PsrC family molybdoenzyme membrane anchor subunit [Polyangia bacterium]|jgi:formate-dependent nitrite reductase membrane component NrfD
MDDELWRRLAQTRDGRNIDPALGTLAGEGAQIEVKRPGEAFPVSPGVAREIPSVLLSKEAPSYYGLPMIKEPVWSPAVPAYFFVGGAAGAASLLASVLALRSPRRKLGRLTRRARWLGALGVGASAGLLIYDLGRPARFLNMLRVFRPSSPMSVGSFILTASGAASGAAALFGERRGLIGALGRSAGLAAGLLGPALAGYTGVLLATTAVPVWQESRTRLPLLFMSSGVTAAASLLELLPATRSEARVLRRYGIAGKAAELAATFALHKEAARVERVARPLRRGASGALLTAATGLTAASLAASLFPGRGRTRTLFGALAGALGSLAMRYAIVQAGKMSARDPHASFEAQRAQPEIAGAPSPSLERPTAPLPA